MISHDKPLDFGLFWTNPFNGCAQNWKMRNLRPRWKHVSGIFRAQHYLWLYFGVTAFTTIFHPRRKTWVSTPFLFDTTIHLLGLWKYQEFRDFWKAFFQPGVYPYCGWNPINNGIKHLSTAGFLSQHQVQDRRGGEGSKERRTSLRSSAGECLQDPTAEGPGGLAAIGYV